MIRCKVCSPRHKAREADWAWQPCGPGIVMTFTVLGSHYQGYPVVKVCDSCKRKLQASKTGRFNFLWRGYERIAEW